MKLSILQWNICTKEKPKNVLSQINKLKPDIICLQELTQNFASTGYMDVSSYLSKKLNYHYHFAKANSWPTKKGVKTQGNGIFTRFPIVSKKHYFVKSKDGKKSKGYPNEGRVVALVDVKVNKIKMSIATTHLSYTDSFIETPEKIIEENNFIKIVNGLKNNFVVTGDFNADKNSHIVKEMNKKFQNAGPDYKQNTWSTKKFHYRNFFEDKLNWRLDYVFTSPGIKVLKSNIIKTEFSDHLPILVEIEIQDR